MNRLLPSILFSLSLSLCLGCSSTVKVKVRAAPTELTPSSTLLVVKQSDPVQFESETYAEIVRAVESADPSVLYTEPLLPGAQVKVKLPRSEDGLAVYLIVDDPSRTLWRRWFEGGAAG
ncbi:MAG: hypothetical protein IPN01_22015 [Deltaproteobacteria bacterium]|nr:hypothetical protein [Deltaproteobacteria bacterium]